MATPEQVSAFIKELSGPAQDSMAITSVPASFVVAEGALESTWGLSRLVQDAKNIFGVKADASWHGPVFTMRTRECIQGVWVIQEARWRKYDTWLACLEDHAAFFHQNERYHNCFQHKDGPGFAEAVAAAGYATDPDYAEKIIDIIHAHYLLTLDMDQTKPTVTAPEPAKVIPFIPTAEAHPIPPKVTPDDLVPLTPVPTPAVPVTPANTKGFWNWVKRFF
jgi:flagellum-specific peptidoglycan hydrolase FlgJ